MGRSLPISRSSTASEMGAPARTMSFVQAPYDSLPERPRVTHPYFSSEVRTVEVGSRHFGPLKTHVRVFGSGPPLLLVHGLMTSSYSWRYVLDALGDNYTLYAPDLPGSGSTDKPAVSYGAEETAEFIGELMEELGIEGCPLVGNSMGGYLSMRLALIKPALVSKLVNIHSPGFPEPRLYALRAALSIPGMRAALSWYVRRSPFRWAHRNVHYRDESLKSLEESRVYGAPLQTRQGASAFAAILGDTLDPRSMARFQAELTRRTRAGVPFPVPLLLLWAREDPMVPPGFGPRFKDRIPSAQFEWIEDASHFAHVDQPSSTAAAILRFLCG